MAQRVILALGLTGNPVLVIADEPTRGLDSTARDRYLMLTRNVYAKAAFLMITHDINAAAACDHIMVMYSGRIVEAGPAEQILSTPLHPYTQGLMASHPDNGMKAIPGMPPNLDTPVSGCEFYPRCRLKTKDCDRRLPEPRNNGERHIRCFHA
jgi:oligopeptide/dipeptide ABC transporter ATP-binding protein